MVTRLTPFDGGAGRRRTGVALLAAVLALALPACAGGGEDEPSAQAPWGPNTVGAADLARELESADKPVVVCTAPPSMYRMGHIPGAVLHGPATSPAVMGQLAAWARTLPRESSVVIYCGCCPLAYCPNLRPAYNALKDVGFRRLRVLILPENFGTDWVDKNLPVTR